MKKLFLFLFFFIFLNIGDSVAQCAKCRATVENNVNNGEIGIASTLNFGIIYLFSAPYLLALVIGLLWYRNSKNRKKKVNIKELLSRNKKS